MVQPASAIAVATALLAVVASGCIEGDRPLDSAMDAQATALPRAQAWQADAQLAWAQTFELRHVPAETDGDGPGFAVNDSRPGDGFAGAWFLVYSAPSRPDAAMTYVVLSNGSIAHEEPFQARTEAGPVSVQFHTWPVRDWRVDSARAGDIAQQNATWARILPRATGASWSLFGGNDTDPVWIGGITDRNLSGDREADAPGEGIDLYINATSGELLAERPPWLDAVVAVAINNPFGVMAEGDTTSGTLTATQPAARHEFVIGPGHPSLRLRVAQDLAVPTQTLAVVLTAPDGTVTEEDATGGPARFKVDAPSAGTWTVDLVLTGVATRYTLCWWAEGSLLIPSPQFDTCT